MEHQPTPLKASQRVSQIALILLALVAIFAGSLQMYLGQPDTTARLDNIHRFLAGIYIACGLIVFWAALTIRKQDTLVFLIAIGVFLGAIGRLVSMSIVGLPEPDGLWLGYLSSEIVIPLVLIFSQLKSNRELRQDSK